MTVEPDVDIAIGLLKSLLTNADEYPIPQGQQEPANQGGHSDPVFYSSANRSYWYAPASTLSQNQKRVFADKLEELASVFLERAVLFRRDVQSNTPPLTPDSDTARVDGIVERAKRSILLRLEARSRAGNTA